MPDERPELPTSFTDKIVEALPPGAEVRSLDRGFDEQWDRTIVELFVIHQPEKTPPTSYVIVTQTQAENWKKPKVGSVQLSQRWARRIAGGIMRTLEQPRKEQSDA